MNTNKELNSEEKKKIMDIYYSLEKTVEQNTQNIVSYKNKLETINEEISMHKKLAVKYEKKLEEHVSELVNIEWNQIKAKTVRKADIEFIEKIKRKRRNEHCNPNNKVVYETNQIAKIKEEKDNLEVKYKEHNELIEKLFSQYQKLNDECELYQTSSNKL